MFSKAAACFLVFVLCVASLFITCNPPNSSDSPDDDTTLVTTVTVGPDGDTITLDNFILQIPQGSFSTSNILFTLYQ